MFIVYLLQSLSNHHKIYIGFTARKMILRLKDHNDGRVKSTKFNRPWNMIYCEVYLAEEDARDRERKLKEYGSAWGHLKKRLNKTLKA